MSSPAATVAFFGATGDCAGYCLTAALNEGFMCSALVRSSEKLTKSLLEKGVQREVMEKRLHIVQGNVKDVDAVKRALCIDGQLVDLIVSGIGGTPILQWSLREPVILTDRTICQDAGGKILAALAELKSNKKPLLVNVSTTGIPPAGCPRDVPLLFGPLYHWLLKVPHADKRVLENNLVSHMSLPQEDRALGGYVNVRPSLLLDGEAKGVAALREGVDEKPAVGYTVRRQDVGKWMFERLIKEQPKAEWIDNGVTVTY